MEHYGKLRTAQHREVNKQVPSAAAIEGVEETEDKTQLLPRGLQAQRAS